MFKRKQKIVHECPLAVDVRKQTRNNRARLAFEEFTKITKVIDEYLYKTSVTKNVPDNALTYDGINVNELVAYGVFDLINKYYSKRGYTVSSKWSDGNIRIDITWEKYTREM